MEELGCYHHPILQYDEDRLVRQALMDYLHEVLLIIDPRDVLQALAKVNEAPSFLDLVPRLVQSSDVMAQEMKD